MFRQKTPFLIIIFFLLSSCQQVGRIPANTTEAWETITPGVTETRISTSVPATIANTPIEEETQVFETAPPPTIISEQEWLDRWLYYPVCTAPCWEGITPGQTKGEDVVDILAANSLFSNIEVYIGDFSVHITVCVNSLRHSSPEIGV